MKQKLAKVKYLSSTCDLWTCRGKAYIGVTVNYINPNDISQRVSNVIACKRLEGSHNHLALAKELSIIYRDFGVSGIVGSCVTDNAASFVKAFR
jgi:hypothetical protein